MFPSRFFVLLLASAAFACARPPANNVSATQPSEEVSINRLAAAHNNFGFELFRQLLEREPGENIFISPTSVTLALSMTWNGARGETKEAMAQTLSLSGLTTEEVNKASAFLLSSLRSADPKVQLEIANSLWARKGISFSSEFLKLNHNFYGAEVRTLDFASPAAIKTINAWVAQKTHNRIKSIISQLVSEEVLVLINAVYFKGKWASLFDKKLTRERNFYRADGTAKLHPLMHQEGEYQYYAGEGFQLVRLPYGKGQISLLVFLPEVWEPEEPAPRQEGKKAIAGRGLAVLNLARRLTQENWKRWLDNLQEKKGEIALPKFRLEYEKSLNEVLKEMGMAPAFDWSRANFTGMMSAVTDMQFAISDVRHKSFVEVNEEGTEAAAVTAVKMIATAVPTQPEKFVMIVDRPFLYAIQDEKTGAILFLGAVFDPKD